MRRKYYASPLWADSIYVDCPEISFPVFPLAIYLSECYENWGKYSVWDCDKTEFLVGRSRMNEEYSTTKMELLIVCVSVCVSCAVIQFLTPKNTIVVEIHRQLTEVCGSDVMSVRVVRKWCRKFCKVRHKVHHESCTGCPKVVTDEFINMIRTVLNEDRHLTLRELEMIMNDDSGIHLHGYQSLVL